MLMYNYINFTDYIIRTNILAFPTSFAFSSVQLHERCPSIISK